VVPPLGAAAPPLEVHSPEALFLVAKDTIECVEILIFEKLRIVSETSQKYPELLK
jgi:hypothetical protein